MQKSDFRKQVFESDYQQTQKYRQLIRKVDPPARRKSPTTSRKAYAKAKFHFLNEQTMALQSEARRQAEILKEKSVTPDL